MRLEAHVHVGLDIFRSVLTLAGATYGRKEARERKRERGKEREGREKERREERKKEKENQWRAEPVEVDEIGSTVNPMEGIVEGSAEG